MNSPLFNPFYGPQQAMVKLGLAGKDDCLKDLAEGSGTDAASVSKRGALKDAQVNFKFATDPVTDPAGSTNHILQILDASTVSDLVTYTASGKIISENLPLEVLVQAGASADLADTLSENSITALLALTTQAPAIVASAVGATEAQAMVGGQATKANAVAAGIVALLNQAGIAGATVERMDAIFGVYGQLPTVYVALSDCTVLIDATTGAVTAPIKLHTQLDASGLLLLHPEAAASPFAHRMMSARGCGYVVAPHWQPTAPPGFVPAAPGVPGLPPFKLTPPGETSPWDFHPSWTLHHTDWSCRQLSSGCTCKRYGLGIAPSSPGWIYVKETCAAPVCPSAIVSLDVSPPDNTPGWNCGGTPAAPSPQYYY